MDFARARRKMVDNQVRPNDVTDLRLVAAMRETPRERFAPPDKAEMAYVDADLPLNEADQGRSVRFLLKPMVLARLIQMADVKPTDRVLDVACGTGYSSAILARLAESVVALEEERRFADRAAQLLHDLGAVNAKVVSGALNAGWSTGAPYDVILINGAVEVVPEALLSQVADGGRLVAVVGGAPIGKAMRYWRSTGDMSGRPVFEATTPVLPSFHKPRAFIF